MFLRIFVLIFLASSFCLNAEAARDPIRSLIRKKDFSNLKKYHQLKTNSKLKKVEYSGYLNSFYIDYADHSKSKIISRLDVSPEKSFQVYFASENLKELSKAEKIKVKAYEYEGELAIEEYTVEDLKPKFRLEEANTSDASGVQNLLVARIVDPLNNTATEINTDEFVAATYFSNSDISLQTYFNEVSSSRMSFSGGTFTDVLPVNNVCDGSDITYIGGIRVLNALAAAGVDVLQFNRFSFVVPLADDCLGGALGIASIGHVVVGLNGGGTFRYSVNFIKSSETGDISDFVYVLAHEFGHNLGLFHDNGNSCGKEIFSASCGAFNYGGEHSIMGRARSLAHVNAIKKEDLGWTESSEIRTLDSANIDEEITIIPVSSSSTATKAVKINRGDGSYYVLEYRKPIGMDAVSAFSSLSPNHSGYLVYLNDDSFIWDSILIDATFNDYRAGADVYIPEIDLYIDQSGQTSFHDRSVFSGIFEDQVNKIRVTPISLSATEARFRIQTGTAFDAVDDNNDSNNDGGNNDSGGGDTSSNSDIKEGWNIVLGETNPTVDKVTNFSLNKNNLLPSVDLFDEIKTIEWDFDGDLVIDSTTSDSFFASHTFVNPGLVTPNVEITFNDDSSIHVLLDPITIESLYDIDLDFKKTNITSGDPALLANKQTKYVLRINPGTETYNRVFKIRIPSALKGLVKIKKKSFKVKANKEVKIPIKFAPESKFIERGLSPVNGYYDIVLNLLTKESKKASIESFSPSFKVQSAI